jgi:nicotinate phosphoribosyltransferase
VLLVDTYDTLAGVQHVVQLARELGRDFHVQGIRLDSGDLATLSKEARRILDDVGLTHLEIFASSSLDEYEIEKLLADGAPITGFGVGGKMGVSADCPYLDSAYKLVEYASEPRIKLSPGKITTPGRKQIFRQSDRDVIGLQNEHLEGAPLLTQMMSKGRRLDAGRTSLEEARGRRNDQLQVLPERLQELMPVAPYQVELSAALRALLERSMRTEH